MPYRKINSKWIKDLKVRPDIIKLIEETIGRTLCNINHSRMFFHPPPRLMKIKTKFNTWTLSWILLSLYFGCRMKQLLCLLFL